MQGSYEVQIGAVAILLELAKHVNYRFLHVLVRVLEVPFSENSLECTDCVIIISFTVFAQPSSQEVFVLRFIIDVLQLAEGRSLALRQSQNWWFLFNLITLSSDIIVISDLKRLVSLTDPSVLRLLSLDFPEVASSEDLVELLALDVEHPLLQQERLRVKVQ